jgi:acyl-CoA thioester hydrolase
MNNEPDKNEFKLQVRVYYEDTDAGGVVYHSNYLKFMERARTEWLRHIGFEQDILIEENEILFAVRHINIDFHKPAHFNELLNVKTHITDQRKASLVFEQIIFNQTEEIICKARIKIACLNYKTMKPEPIPETIISELN